MALELVTGYWGQEHVTADQDADLNAGVIGSDRYVLPIGEKMRAEAVTSNKIRIFDGVFAGYGRQCQIEEGAYVDVEIENGTAGLLRNDMIIVKYAKDETTGIEGVSFGVLKGQTGTTATDPVPNNQDIRTGAFESEMPLYRVKLNGLAIEAIQPLYSVPKTLAELTASLTTLNRNLQVTTGTPTKSGNIASNPIIKQFGSIKMLKINTTTTLNMASGTDYTLCTLAVVQRPDTDYIKYVSQGKLTISAAGGVFLTPSTALSSGTYLHITETFI